MKMKWPLDIFCQPILHFQLPLLIRVTGKINDRNVYIYPFLHLLYLVIHMNHRT